MRRTPGNCHVQSVGRMEVSIAAQRKHARRKAVLLLAALVIPTAAQAQPHPAPEDLTLVLEIGSDLADEAAALYRIADLAVGAGGKLYVLDSGNHQVTVFDSTGQRITAFGRRDGGPGEFLFPIRIVVDSVVRVFDAGHYRVSMFAPDGSHLETVRLPSIPGHNVTGLHPLRGGHGLATTTARFTRGPDSDPYVTLLAVRLPSTVVDTLARLRSSGALWHKRDAYAPWSVVDSGLGEGGAWALAADSLLAIADGYAGTVSFFGVSEAGFARVVEVQLPERGRPLTEAERRAIVSAAVEKSRLKAADVMVELPPMRSAATAAVFSDTGELWVRTVVEGGMARWCVIDPSRGVVREVRLPEGFKLEAVHGDLLYGTATTELGSPVVRVYRLWRSVGEVRGLVLRGHERQVRPDFGSSVSISTT